ncbi:MAG: hypothetical protein ACYSYU_00245 [Planctomycetota bacterium]|jgi:hypothetical protein
MPTRQKATAVKKAWSEANKLHKAMSTLGVVWSQSDGHYSDNQGTQSTPGLARRYNSLMKKGLVPKQSGLKNKVLGYSEWLANEGKLEEPAQVSSKETTSPTKGAAIPLTVVEVVDFKVLENLSQTCRRFQITPNELVAHVNILEQLQVLDTTCVQDAVPENQANAKHV